MEDGEARLFGPRDGKGGGKFRGIYGLNTESAHGLSTGRAGGEIRGARVRPVFEAIAAQAHRTVRLVEGRIQGVAREDAA